MEIKTSNSTVNFTIKKLFFLTVEGKLPGVIGTVNWNENDLSTSNVELQIPLANLDTKNAKRNEHLKQKDFFNVAEYPKIVFSSNEITKENNQFWVNGLLMIAGTTNNIKFPFQLKDGNITGKLSLDRNDFKVGKIPSFIASNIVNITFNCLIS
ncbi:YceI family protein [Crocinitomix catalasitica]|uniref:YceI family protein n=1 Tax=Crocinitomix catalasitica TaxID=184607 RepID=UPI000483A511|nr:YceI family protein [Crocinitomix catalasitica]